MRKRAFVCFSCVMALTALRRRHFEAPLAPPSTAAGRAELRVNLHAVVDARICAAFGTELAIEPGRCDSMSVNRQDSSIRTYTPQDGNVEVLFKKLHGLVLGDSA